MCSVQPPAESEKCSDVFMRNYKPDERFGYSPWGVYTGNGNVVQCVQAHDEETELPECQGGEICDYTDGEEGLAHSQEDSDESEGNAEQPEELLKEEVGALNPRDCSSSSSTQALTSKLESNIKCSVKPPGEFMECSDEFIRSCRRGDRIEINRVLFSHWVIYIGNGNVACFAGNEKTHPKGVSGFVRSVSKAVRGKLEGEIMIQKLSVIAAGSTVRVNNRKDIKCSPRSEPDITRDVLDWFGRKLHYSPIIFNCKHFVDMIRYGEEELVSRAKQRSIEDI